MKYICKLFLKTYLCLSFPTYMYYTGYSLFSQELMKNHRLTLVGLKPAKSCFLAQIFINPSDSVKQHSGKVQKFFATLGQGLDNTDDFWNYFPTLLPQLSSTSHSPAVYPRICSLVWWQRGIHPQAVGQHPWSYPIRPSCP